MEVPKADIGQVLLVVVLFVGLMLVLLLTYTLMAPPSSGQSGYYVALPENTVVFVHFGDANVAPYRSFAKSHGLEFYSMNVDDPQIFILLGERRIPLIPPVVSLPAYMCLAADSNRIIGYIGSDLNVYRLVVSKCRGYTGPAYVVDENGHVVEVNV